jgi:hypothetical protein
VLAVVGAISQQLDPIWKERQELLLSWLPRAEALVLPDAMHLMHAQNPRGMAEALAAFFAVTRSRCRPECQAPASAHSLFKSNSSMR